MEATNGRRDVHEATIENGVPTTAGWFVINGAPEPGPAPPVFTDGSAGG